MRGRRRPGPSTASRWWPGSSPRSPAGGRRAARRPAARRCRPVAVGLSDPARCRRGSGRLAPGVRHRRQLRPRRGRSDRGRRRDRRPDAPAGGPPFRRPAPRGSSGALAGRRAGPVAAAARRRLRRRVAPPSATSSASRSGYLVYWDQDEEVDYYRSADRSQGQLMAPWDLNGQTCVLNDGTGRFIGRLGPDQSEPAQSRGPAEPPVQAAGRQRGGEQRPRRVHRQDAVRPRALPDGPRAAGPGRAGRQHRRVQRSVHLHGVRGRRPSTTSSPATSGRPRDRSRSPPTAAWSSGSRRPTPRACVLYGPDTGGSGRTTPTASGGLSQPGMMTALPNGNILVPQAGSASGGFPGDVLEFDHSSFPTSASQCPDGRYPRSAHPVVGVLPGDDRQPAGADGRRPRPDL